MLNVHGQSDREAEIARLKHDWETKEKARIGLQATRPEGLEAIMAAKKLEMDAYLKYMEVARHFRGAVLIQENGRLLFDGGF